MSNDVQGQPFRITYWLRDLSCLSRTKQYPSRSTLTPGCRCRSIDRKLLEGFCELADVPVVSQRSPAEWWNTSVCDTPGLLMMHVWNQGARRARHPAWLPLPLPLRPSIPLGSQLDLSFNFFNLSIEIPPT